MEIGVIDILSYGSNIVFVTWGVVAMIKEKSKKKETANFLNAAFESAQRLAESLQDNHAQEHAKDIASFLKSATMNCMDAERDEIGCRDNNNSEIPVKLVSELMKKKAQK
ncbi:MAG: hypothetical protein ACOYS2_01235 [Patescibacteria group bacterium]